MELSVPITRLHLFPFIQFSASLLARGQFRDQQPTALVQRQAVTSDFRVVLDEKPEDEPEEAQGFRFELFVAKGAGDRASETLATPVREGGANGHRWCGVAPCREA